jgi:uncharacterized protein (TIGR02466 family)
MVAFTYEYYFPTIIAYADLPDYRELNQYLSKQIYQWREQDPAGIIRSNNPSVGGWHSPATMHTKLEFREFGDRVTATIQDYFLGMGYEPSWQAICQGMWANISPKFAFNSSHIHGGCLCSGVYYVQAKAPTSGRLRFEDPREQSRLIVPEYREGAQNAATWETVYYDPIPGRIIMFPAWLRHDVGANLTDEDRISISFNYTQSKLEK